MSALQFERSERDRILAGVCGGLGERLGVDATLVRLLFALLALAGGAGILLYLALWSRTRSRRPIVAIVLVAAAAAALLSALGLSAGAVLGGAAVVLGIVLVLARGGSVRPGGSIPIVGIALLSGGALVLLGRHGPGGPFVAPGAVVGALALVIGPWVWQLWTERSERIRLEERAAVAARVHDSVLQTLALVQRHADDPARVASLARRQERELRRWLYGSGVAEASTLVDALTDAAADVEELHRIKVELASAGDASLDASLEPLVLAAREAMTNAAKFAGVEDVSVYVEAGPDEVSVYVRDRGTGFDPAAVPAGRRGIADSIVGRMRAAGGSATVMSTPGDGTEVELRLPRSAE